MRKVSIIGVGSTKFGKLEGVGIKELAAQACLEALADANLPREKVQAFYLGNYIAERLVGQGSLAPMVASALGLKRIPTTKVEGACASGPGTLYEMRDLTTFDCTIEAAKEAYEMAGLSPQDIDVAEVHDCFTIAEIMAIEDLGFFEKGKGGPAVEEGLTEVGGRIPVNPSGGLLSKGHPVGATGAAQLYELVKQLRGEAGNQVKEAEIGLAQNLGGTGAICTVHILRQRG